MPVACVTGASAGLGRAFCQALARSGQDLVVVARDSDRLETLAAQWESSYGVKVEVIPADLTDPSARSVVEARLADPDRPVDLLVNNAGHGTVGRFWERPVEPEESVVVLNTVVVLRLTHAVLPGMVRRGRGAILTVSSVAGLVPGASSPTYGAAKAFEVMFTDNLAVALAGTGVRACVVCPGLARTEFHARAGMDVSGAPGWSWLDADRVVADALADLGRGSVRSVPARRYRWPVAVAGALPSSWVRRLGAGVSRGRRPGDERP